MSTTYASNIIAILALGLPVLGFEVVDRDTLAGIISALIGVAALVYNFYGRFKAGGITAFGIRKAQ